MIIALNLSYAEVIDKIVVVVNNEVITQREVDRTLGPIYEQYRALYSNDEIIEKLEEARQKVIGQLIDDKLILSEAKRLNIEVHEKEIDAWIEDTIKRIGSKEKFDKALAEQNLTLKDLRARYQEQIMTRRLIDQKIGSRITITPIEVREYYNKHQDEFIQPEQIKLRNILIKPQNGLSVEKAIGLVKQISNRIREGEDFAGLAKEYSHGPGASEGGLMGYVKKGDLLPELEKVAFNLKEGEISDVIQTSLGYHIFKVEARNARQILELSEVQHQIEEAVFREKVRERLKGWLEDLKKNAYIAFK